MVNETERRGGLASRSRSRRVAWIVAILCVVGGAQMVLSGAQIVFLLTADDGAELKALKESCVGFTGENGNAIDADYDEDDAPAVREIETFPVEQAFGGTVRCRIVRGPGCCDAWVECNQEIGKASVEWFSVRVAGGILLGAATLLAAVLVYRRREVGRMLLAISAAVQTANALVSIYINRVELTQFRTIFATYWPGLFHDEVGILMLLGMYEGYGMVIATNIIVVAIVVGAAILLNVPPFEVVFPLSSEAPAEGRSRDE